MEDGLNTIVYVTDRAYLGPTLASMRSVRNVWPLDLRLSIVVGFDGVATDEEVWALEQWAAGLSIDLSVVPIASLLDGLELPMGTRLRKRHTRTVWATLWLSEIVDEGASRVLYMDGDCMAVRDPSRLLEMDLSGFVAAAVRDDPVPTVSSAFGVPKWATYGMNADDPYFNSGVLLVDMAAWRDANIGESARRILAAYGGVPEQYDQEILNIALWSRWCELDTAWNTTSWWFRSERRVAGRETVLDDAAIIHFSGPSKPWSEDALQNVYAEEFLRYLGDVEVPLSRFRA